MKKILFLLSALIVSIAIQAQTFEEFKKQRADEMAAMKQKQEEFINRMQNEFNDYVKQRDQEFADFLKKQWEQFNVMKGIAPPERPKPSETPEYKPEPAREGQWSKMPVIKPPVNVKKEMQKEIKEKLNKIYPLKNLEIRSLEEEKHHAAKETEMPVKKISKKVKAKKETTEEEQEEEHKKEDVKEEKPSEKQTVLEKTE